MWPQLASSTMRRLPSRRRRGPRACLMGHGPQKTAAAPERARVARQLEADLREKSGAKNGGSRKARRLEKRHRGPKMGAAGRPPFSATRRGGAWFFRQGRAGENGTSRRRCGQQSIVLCCEPLPAARGRGGRRRRGLAGECGSARAAASAPRRAAGVFFAGRHARAAAHALHSRRAPPPADVPAFSRAAVSYTHLTLPTNREV